MIEQDDNAYMQLIVGFLLSPKWKTPVKNFIDEHCIEFEETSDDSLEPEFQRLHKEYNKIVEDLLKAMKAELGVSEQ